MEGQGAVQGVKMAVHAKKGFLPLWNLLEQLLNGEFKYEPREG
jgi:hypothetical protein